MKFINEINQEIEKNELKRQEVVKQVEALREQRDKKERELEKLQEKASENMDISMMEQVGAISDEIEALKRKIKFANGVINTRNNVKSKTDISNEMNELVKSLGIDKIKDKVNKQREAYKNVINTYITAINQVRAVYTEVKELEQHLDSVVWLELEIWYKENVELFKVWDLANADYEEAFQNIFADLKLASTRLERMIYPL